jgi:hypothetical protein
LIPKIEVKDVEVHMYFLVVIILVVIVEASHPLEVVKQGWVSHL